MAPTLGSSTGMIQNNRSTVPDLPCYRTISLTQFTHLAVGPALLIVLFLSIFEKRKNFRHWKCFNGRPGLLVPVNLLDGDEDRMAYAAAFGSTATNCLTLIQGHFIPPDCPMWFKIFYAMLAVLEMGIDYYPFFACLSKKNSFIDTVIGLVYSVLWFLVNLSHVFDCSDDSNWVFRGQPIVIQLPVLVCLMYLICIFFSRFLTIVLYCFVRLFSGKLFDPSVSPSTEQLIKATDSQDFSGYTKYQVNHVTELLKGKKSTLPSISQLEKLNGSVWSIIRYRHDPTYRFSVRVTSTFTVALLCLYEFALLSFLAIDKTLDTVQDEFDKIDKSAIIVTFGADILKQLDLLIHTVRGCWYTAYIGGSVIMANYVIKIFLKYRLHSCKLMRGDYSFIPEKIRSMSSSMILSRSLMYSGSQVAYMLWGYYFTILMLFIYFMIISYFLVLPFAGKVDYNFLFIFWTIFPSVFVSYLLFYTQQFLSKKIFLQKGTFADANHRLRRALALDNRRVYHIVSYFLFFFYIFVGLCKCIIRVFKGVVLGVAYLSRLDRCNLIPGFEHWDPGYLSYLSILRLEMTHCHPVLVTFCHGLTNSRRSRYSSVLFHAETQEEGLAQSRRRLVINRWLKLYTLLKNPQLRKPHEKPSS